jgi:hypothetical protein
VRRIDPLGILRGSAAVIRYLALSVGLLATACGIMTMRAQDAVQSRAWEDLDCGDAVVAMQTDGTYLAMGCGKQRRYVCDREVASAVGKVGVLSALNCRKAPDAAPAASASAMTQP